MMVRALQIGFAAAGLLGLAACEPAASPANPVSAGEQALEVEVAAEGADIPAADYGAYARARLINVEGHRIGDVHAWQAQEGVLLRIEAHGLPPGFHGAHIHSVGRCDDTGVYTASRGHVGVDDGPHGLLHPGGAHRGDLPNLYAGQDGHAHADFFSPLISLGDIRDADGAALIIHEARDDYQSQPIGGAGFRIACAAFRSHP